MEFLALTLPCALERNGKDGSRGKHFIDSRGEEVWPQHQWEDGEFWLVFLCTAKSTSHEQWGQCFSASALSGSRLLGRINASLRWYSKQLSQLYQPTWWLVNLLALGHCFYFPLSWCEGFDTFDILVLYMSDTNTWLLLPTRLIF